MKDNIRASVAKVIGNLEFKFCVHIYNRIKENYVEDVYCSNKWLAKFICSEVNKDRGKFFNKESL